MGAKIPYGGFFLMKFLIKKAVISHSASCNGGMFVLTKVGSKLVHSIIPNE
jgi:hypothetical protein